MLPLVVGELSWLVGVGFVLDLPPILLPLSLLGLSKSVRSVENIVFSIKALFYFYKKKHLRTLSITMTINQHNCPLSRLTNSFLMSRQSDYRFTARAKAENNMI